MVRHVLCRPLRIALPMRMTNRNWPIGKRKSAGFFVQRFFLNLMAGEELEYDGKALLRRVLPLFAFLVFFTAAAAASGKGGS